MGYGTHRCGEGDAGELGGTAHAAGGDMPYHCQHSDAPEAHGCHPVKNKEANFRGHEAPATRLVNDRKEHNVIGTKGKCKP